MNANSNANQMDLIHGRSAMWGIEAELLTEICKSPGDHIEVGSLWGASAIIAARAKPRPGRIYSIDIMCGGYWSTGDPGCKLRIPTARDILENFAAAGVADRVTLVCSPSFPFPLPPEIRPSTALIDAAHDAESVGRDWHSLSPITSHFIALHDYGEQHPAVETFINDCVLADPGWRKYRQAHSLLVMERVPDR